MARIGLPLPPGSSRRATSQDTRQGWWDMSLVRFPGGIMTPIGGWASVPGLKFSSPPRSVVSWRDLTSIRWIGAAAMDQVQVYNGATNTSLDITPGDWVAGSIETILDGFGVGPFGVGPWGTHRPMETQQYAATPIDSVTLDNWGQNLLCMGSADGRLLQWVPGSGGSLTPVAGAPTGRTFVVTDERACMILGAGGDPRQVAWCSLENLNDWTSTYVNTAGSLELRTSGTGIAMRRVAQGVLIWCDDDVHLAQYVGPPYTYGIARVGTGCGPAGPESMCVMSGRSIWRSLQGFWLWDGAPMPLRCNIDGFLNGDISPLLRPLTFAFHNGIFPECTFGYCTGNGGLLTPDRYATWDYAQNLWTHGELERSIGCDPGAWGLPLQCSAEGYLYQHETGWADDGNPRGTNVFAESGDLQIGEGDIGVYVEAIYPDLAQGNLVQFDLHGQWEAEGADTDFGTYTLTRPDGIIDTDFETRSVRLRIEGVTDGPWQLGRIRLGVKPGAGR